MTTRFETLFTIDISHGYYTELCKDFEFAVPGETARLLLSGRLLAKVLDGVLYVLFEVNESGEPMISIAGKTLRFGLRLLNSSFSNITDLEVDPGTEILVYNNSSNATELDSPEIVTLVGQIFSHALAQSDRPVTVTLQDAGGNVVNSEIVTSDYDRSSVDYDLTNRNPGSHSISEAYPDSTESTAYYCDTELLRLGTMGVIQVTIESSFYVTPPGFHISFDAKEQSLKYYVVAKDYTTSDFNRLSVSDEGYTEDGRPAVNFTRVAVEDFGDDEIAADLLMEEDEKLVLFRSETAVPRHEQARSNIQLRKNGDVIITHLPQPSPGSVNSDFVIHITKP